MVSTRVKLNCNPTAVLITKDEVDPIASEIVFGVRPVTVGLV